MRLYAKEVGLERVKSAELETATTALITLAAKNNIEELSHAALIIIIF